MTSQCIARMACLVACALPSGHVFADLPLNIEDLITDKGKVRLDLALTYGNDQGKSIHVGKAVKIPTGLGDYPELTMPGTTSEGFRNNDALAYSVGLRYGLTARAEIYGRATASITQRRTAAAGLDSTDTRHQFNDLWSGLSYQFKHDDGTPAVLAFAEVALMERYASTTSNLRSAMLGGTAFTSIDPVVLSMTAAYHIRRPYTEAGNSVNPGNEFFLTPSVSFAANDRVTLTTGFQWTNQERSRINGRLRGIRHTSTGLQFGVGYSVSKGKSLNLSVKLGTGGEGAQTRLNWIQTL